MLLRIVDLEHDDPNRRRLPCPRAEGPAVDGRTAPVVEVV